MSITSGTSDRDERRGHLKPVVRYYGPERNERERGHADRVYIVGKGEGMRLYKIDDATNTVDLGQVEILFYHGRPVAFKDFDSKTLYAMTETVSSDTTFRRDFKKSWSGKFEVTGGQAELETKIREALRER